MRLVQQRRGDYFRRDCAEGHAVGGVSESIMHAWVAIGMGTEVRCTRLFMQRISFRGGWCAGRLRSLTSRNQIDETSHAGLVDEAGVNFTNGRPREHIADIVLTNAAAGDDRDTPPRLIHQCGD
jgi:hypothetical protein